MQRKRQDERTKKKWEWVLSEVSKTGPFRHDYQSMENRYKNTVVKYKAVLYYNKECSGGRLYWDATRKDKADFKKEHLNKPLPMEFSENLLDVINQIEGMKHAVTGGFNVEATGDPQDVEDELLEKKDRADKRKRGHLQDDDSGLGFKRTRGKRNDTLSSVADAFKTLVKQQGKASVAANAAAAERAEERRLVALRHAEVLAAQKAAESETRAMAKEVMLSQASSGTETANAIMTAAQSIARSLTSTGLGINRVGAALDKGFCFDLHQKSAPVLPQDPGSNEGTAKTSTEEGG